MKRLSLLRTTAVRLAVKYTVFYALALGLALAAFVWITSRSVDTQLKSDLTQDLSSLVHIFETRGVEQLAQAVVERQDAASGEGRFSILVGRHGEKLAGNLLGWPEAASIGDGPDVKILFIEEEVIPRGLVEDDVYWPAIVRELPDGSRLLLARRIDQAAELQQIAGYLTEFSAAALLLALLMGVTIGRTILRRMDAISRTAGNIMAGDLSQRVLVSRRRDEFDLLAGQLNAMLDRIQQLIKGIRQTTDNIAHDLRSPLTRLRNQLEITLLESRSEQEYRQAIAQGIEEAESLIKTFNALLEIAQAEAGHHRTQWGLVQLDQLASDLVDLYKPVAEEKGQTLELVDCEPAPIHGSRHLLAQVIGNLLENAIKYTPAGGTITVRCHPAAGTAELIVADTGPGIPESERERVFERFVRLDSSRHTPGNGLGLSLVKAVSELHHAELQLSDADPGLIVAIRFPAA